MSLVDHIRAEKLLKFAGERFGPDLTEPEKKILLDSADSFDLDDSEPQAPWPTVSPEFMRWLATDPDAASQIDPKGIRVIGVSIPGNLDFEGCRIATPLTFRWCAIEGEIKLDSAETEGIFLLDSSLDHGIQADRIKIRGPLFLDGSKVSGEILLVGARISGQLSCSGAKLCPKTGKAPAEMSDDPFDDQSNSEESDQEIDALSADGAEILGDVFLDKEFLSTGAIRFTGSLVHGDLDCTDANLTARNGRALIANRAEIRGTVFLYGQFKSTGTVSLIGAQIKGDLDCKGAKLLVNGRPALEADRVEVGGTVFLNQGFESSGSVSFHNARIKGELVCNGAKLSKKDGDALLAVGLEIGGRASLIEHFESSGTIRFSGARIKGELNLDSARLLVADGDALVAESAKIEGGVFLREGFESSGAISLLGAQVGGQVAFFDAKVEEVDCTNLCLSGDLLWTGIATNAMTKLKLIGAKVRNLHDDRESWPAQDRLVLDGFVYEELTPRRRPNRDDYAKNAIGEKLPLNVEERIEWLMLQPHDRRIEPQPWVQLSEHLASKGNREGAKQVLFRLRCMQARELEWHPWFWLLGMLAKFWRILLLMFSPRNAIPRAWPYFRNPNRSLALGFAWLEEVPARILYPITLTMLLGCMVFGRAGACGALAPTEVEAYKAFISGRPMPAAYPTLNPFVYTLENAVPLVKLGQDDKWAPDRHHPPATLLTNYWFLMWARWLLILSGWFQATVLAAALLGRFKE